MTATAGLRERKKARTREAIRDAALDLFAVKGFDQTTVEDVAQACEVSPRTFFRYFPSKEDVLFADADGRRERLLSVLADQPRDMPPLQALLQASIAIASDYGAERGRLVARKRILQGSAQLRADSLERQRGWEDAITLQLEERQPPRHPASPFELRLVAATGLAALRVAVDTWLADPAPPKLETLVVHAFERIGHGLDSVPAAS